MNWYLMALKRYVEFAGRSQRKEYWLFGLFNFIILVLLAVVDGFTGTINAATGYGLLSGLYSLAVFIPGLAVSVRRLHDTDRSAWWLLILLVPLVGLIVYIVFMVLDSTPGTNDYGPSPKENPPEPNQSDVI